MSWFSSFVNILVNQNSREVERELTPTIYRNRKFEEYDDYDDDLSDGDSFDDEDDESEDELCFAQNVESRLEEAQDLNLDFIPLVEKANEIYHSSDSEGFALRSSPAAVYATVFRETRPPTPPEPDFPEFLTEGERSRRASLGRFSALVPVQNEIEAKTKKFWGSFQKLAADKGSTLKRKLAPQTQNYSQGQSGFEDLRRHIKQGGDFSKELAAILHERSEAESQYAKCLSKLSLKLSKATKDCNGGTIISTWARVAAEMENESEIHRIFAATLSENLVKPLRSLTDSQHRIRKSVELAVDKSAKNLAEWRTTEAKAKKHSFASARDNEKLRDGSEVKSRISGSSLQISKSEKDTSKLETKRKKAEETVKKADVEYYNVCLRTERSRLEWESAILRGANCFEVMEDERLKGLRTLAELYAKSFKQLSPKLNQIGDRISEPLALINVEKDMETVHSLKSSSEPQHEQILPDFYPEQLTLAMNRERRKQAIVKLLQLIKGDLERERRGKAGVENLVMAFKQTPTFTSEDSQYNVNDKLQHMKSTLAYLEATRYKLESALCEIEGAPSPSHPLASHIQISRDRLGYQQSILKIPAWIHNSDVPSDPLWIDRGTADGTATHTDSDFDEFSSQESIKCEETKSVETAPCVPQRCKALYNYKAKLYDELNLSPGDLINIHDKQADGWWLGELNGTVGIFPATYVEEI